jgi:hypothetical protein
MKLPKLDEKTPHVCFMYQAPSSSGSDDELPQRLVAQLRQRFSSVRTVRIWFGGARLMFLKAGSESHTGGFGKSRYRKGEWILAVTTTRRVGFESQVAVCRKIHESLLEISGITRVRWYFEGSKTQSPAVETPEELLRIVPN